MAYCPWHRGKGVDEEVSLKGCRGRGLKIDCQEATKVTLLEPNVSGRAQVELQGKKT